MPAHAKDPELRQGHHAPPVALTAASAALPAPEPPTGLADHLAALWRALWVSPLATLFDPVTDLPVLSRLWTLYQIGEQLDAMMAGPDLAQLPEADRLAAVVDHRDAFRGLVQTRMRVATETRMTERELGMSPKARLGLGVKLAAAGAGMGRTPVEPDDADD